VSAKDSCQGLIETLQNLKRDGVEQINTEGIITYLHETLHLLEVQPTNELSGAQLEKYKTELQVWAEGQKNIHTQNIESFKSTIDAGQNAIRSSFLMNGAATISLLTFIGKLTDSAPEKIPLFSCSLMLFVSGVGLAGLASGLAYCTQWFYTTSNYAARRALTRNFGHAFNIFSIVLIITSYVVFAYGVFGAYEIFRGFA
jgi:hypothetical protein